MKIEDLGLIALNSFQVVVDVPAICALGVHVDQLGSAFGDAMDGPDLFEGLDRVRNVGLSYF